MRRRRRNWTRFSPRLPSLFDLKPSPSHLLIPSSSKLWTLSPQPRFLLRPLRTKRSRATIVRPMSKSRVSRLRSLHLPPLLFRARKGLGTPFFFCLCCSPSALSTPLLLYRLLSWSIYASLTLAPLFSPLFLTLLVCLAPCLPPSCSRPRLSSLPSSSPPETYSQDDTKLSFLDKVKVKTDWLEEKVVSSSSHHLDGNQRREGGRGKRASEGGVGCSSSNTRQKRELILLFSPYRVWRLVVSSEFQITRRGPICSQVTTQPFGESSLSSPSLLFLSRLPSC